MSLTPAKQKQQQNSNKTQQHRQYDWHHQYLGSQFFFVDSLSIERNLLWTKISKKKALALQIKK